MSSRAAMSRAGLIKHLAVISILAVTAAAVFMPRTEKRTAVSSVDLTAIPAKFGEWTMQDQDTKVGTKESKFVNDILFRTYSRRDGKSVMLAVAYGSDQRKKFSIHLPEVCYKASGFDVTPLGRLTMASPNLRLRQLLVNDAEFGTQPVQYWIVLGGRQVTNDFERRLKHFYYSIMGAEAGGVMVRVSSFCANRDYGRDYNIQNDFITSMYRGVDPRLRKLLFGEGV